MSMSEEIIDLMSKFFRKDRFMDREDWEGILLKAEVNESKKLN